MRKQKNTATDPYSRGRNFGAHYSIHEWNVVPISSPIEVQYSIAPGTAMAQKRAGGRGITIVTGGDAGTAEGDFATCLVWASRPVNPLQKRLQRRLEHLVVARASQPALGPKFHIL